MNSSHYWSRFNDADDDRRLVRPNKQFQATASLHEAAPELRRYAA